MDEQYKTHDVQPFYWMAYHLCKPVMQPGTIDMLEAVEQEPLRRLIWAYDEAQSLDSAAIPSAKQVFGENATKFLKGSYEGGIPRSIVMRKCYRTPAPILTTAHALGMGLLRKAGMIAGLTNKDEWEDIGYEVEGAFRSGQIITLQRPAENSPSKIPESSTHPVLEHRWFSNRRAEVQAVAERIKHDLEHEGLTPERQLLVVVLNKEETNVMCDALQQLGINYYIPSGQTANRRNSHWTEQDRNKFWHEGAVTVSQINRAKGNEANMVYVIGMDRIASHEAQMTKRNELFVAMTRSKSWLHISGLEGDYSLYRELTDAITANGRFEFTYKPPKRDVGEF